MRLLKYFGVLIGVPLLFYAFFHIGTNGWVIFSNDAPMGALMSSQVAPPGYLYGCWADLNWIGASNIASDPMSITGSLSVIFGTWIKIGNDPLFPTAVIFLTFWIVAWWELVHRFGEDRGSAYALQVPALCFFVAVPIMLILARGDFERAPMLESALSTGGFVFLCSIFSLFCLPDEQLG